MKQFRGAFILMIILLCFGLLAGCAVDAELEWHQEEGYKWAELSPGIWGKTGFNKKDTSTTGITFENTLAEEDIVDNRVLMNGSGVAAGDVDGDGLIDLYFARLDGANKLYKNMGNMRFEDVTDEAGVGHSGYYSTGVVFADVDADQDVDLLITTLDGGNALYINRGNGTFEWKKDSGLGPGRGSTTPTLADIDGDGDLDLYIANYKEKEVKDIYDFREITLENITRRVGGEFSLVPPYDEHFRLFVNQGQPDARQLGEQDELYINDGNGHFNRATALEDRFRGADGQPEGLDRDWSLTAKFQDVNGDMLPDLYVCNDFWTPDKIWLNRGDGTFRRFSDPSIRKISYSSMGVDFLDANGDGLSDIFATEMLSPVHERRMRQMVNTSPFVAQGGKGNRQRQYIQNTLQLNRGDTTFAEVAYYAGVEATEWSWATTSVDVDLDGYEDLIVNTGHAYDFQDMDTQEMLGQRLSRGVDIDGYLLEFPTLKLQNVGLHNNGDLTFTDKSRAWGFTEEDISHGLATADLDNDGDLDLAVNRLNQVAAIYENATSDARIAVRLEGNSPNTQAIGAKVELRGGPVRQQREVESGGNYVSGSDPLLVFAAGPDDRNHTLTVTWPGGNESVVEGVRANRVYSVSESPGSTHPSVNSGEGGRTRQQFAEVSTRLNHVHHEDPFDDFKIQPLLPLKLSQLGPGVSWIDFNRDGLDDLFVGGGKGDEMGIFLNKGKGEFSPTKLAGLSGQAVGDHTGIVGWTDRHGQHIVVGSSNYEQGSSSAAAAWHYTFEDGTLIKEEQIPGNLSTTGPLAVADYNADGDLDLFVGGRFKAGHYPQNADSRLFRNENGSFELDQSNSRKLEGIGLVTGAVFSDIDQDEDQDLVLSRAWDSILILENQDGSFRNRSAEMELNSYDGRWNGVATGDFNSDGLPDLVATNWGKNSIYQLDAGRPLKMYYDDFDYDGRVEVLEAYYHAEKEAYVPRRQLYDLDKSIPEIARNIRTHKQYAQLSIGDVVGIRADDIPSRQVNVLEHTVFLNTGHGFTAHPLPPTTQFTAAFDAKVADFDNDGNEDLYLSQNFFALPVMTPRQDAGRGALLKGDGEGNFEMIPGHVSGIRVYGEQRGAGFSDFNRDGKVDLAVSQNEGATRLYVNQAKSRGLRVRPVGPENNIDGIGSSVRLIYQDGRKGPRREIQAGSGYWSQDGAVPILGIAGKPARVQVAWTDGTTQEVDVSWDVLQEASHWEIEVRHPSLNDK
jgi:hypothetical protein